jgi:aminoglycoside/choline kinase family phosphotransferase
LSDRAARSDAFIAASPYAGWRRLPLAGDASARRFERLAGPQGTAILMDADPATGERLGGFIAIAGHLGAHGLAAPAILAADTAQGFALVEDLGADHFAAWLTRHPGDTETLYAAAVDVLVRLQTVPPPPGLPDLGPLRGAAMIAPLFDFYCPGTDERLRAHVTGLLQEALLAHAPVARTFALRDFHAENLIWRPDRSGTDRVGLIDFQDAVTAAPEYDLTSLLRDARRDVDAGLRDRMMRRFAGATGRTPDQVAAASAVIGVQRNLRILGIFARLARRDGKRRYLDLLPRVWGHVADDLGHPALAALAQVLNRHLPPPDAVQIRAILA